MLHFLGRREPSGGSSENCTEVNEAARHPHDQAGKLLIVFRIYAYGTKSQPRAEQAAGRASDKQIRDGGKRSKAPAFEQVENGPPENRASEGKAELLSHVQRLVG